MRRDNDSRPARPLPRALSPVSSSGRGSAFAVREAEGKDVESTRELLKEAGASTGLRRAAPAAQRLLALHRVGPGRRP